MNVIVIGADSQVGQFVIRNLMERGHQSIAVINEENKVHDMKKLGASKVEANGREDFTAAFSECDAVIFISDSSPNTGAGKTVLVDHQAVLDAVQAAQQNGVKRFIMMSAVRVGEGPTSSDEMIGAKDKPDEWIKEEAIVHTIVRPARMTDEPGRGKVAIADSITEGDQTIPREDVAALLVAVLESETALNQVFEVASGDMAIDEAVQALG
ncbi:hypothetical protein AC623_15455 [Bacillus sp. FJAT-27231]|uniref:NAD(P)H-binding protein n=1 Tax=Bacillus sp. FJAT-27231 TaxID=1679168 RepID=UPI0006716527|nr:NAD(P)H-binding protein [Bacillus sp. FJAT-27231]KMY55146.1 hypothetical protein AC623_15455 [Bacillus sp. FJAT-27231]